MPLQKKSRASEPTSEVIALLQAALEHQKAGRMAEAEKLFRKCVKEEPDRSEILLIAAMFFVQTGNHQYAITLLNKCVSKPDADIRAIRLMGEALYRSGDYDQSKSYLGRALALDSGDPEASGLMALCLYKMGQVTPAILFFRASLEKKDSVEVMNSFAEILLMQGNLQEAERLLSVAVAKNVYNYDTLIRLIMTYKDSPQNALKYILRAIKLDPTKDEAKTMLGLWLDQDIIPKTIHPEMAFVILECLKSRFVNHNDLVFFWHQQTFENPEDPLPNIIAQQKDYTDFKSLYNDPETRRAFLTPLFIEGLGKIIVIEEKLELLYTRLRTYYLDLVQNRTRTLDVEEIELLKAMAIQCFFNEYVFDEPPEETKAIEELKILIEKSLPKTEEWLIYASYRPLLGLKKNDHLKGCDEVLRVHIQEPKEEQRIKKSLKTFGKIKNDVSRKVREQYEENPYPRWRYYSYKSNFLDTSIDSRHHKISKRILIAGCGTGKNIIITHSMHPHSDITAIDLSSSSLAYAMRKCREYGLKNVKFLQGDILDLADLGGPYDHISCSGVLHHMASPEAGLKVLTGLLAPDGTIDLGLYSELARQDVVKMRAYIEEQKLTSSPEDIRKARQYIKNSDRHAFQFIRETGDFYKLSACRDLMFHVQETRYTIPQLKKFLDSQGLEFVGFNITKTMMDAFLKEFPEDTLGKNLDHWDAFEHKNPLTFRSMYQLTAQHKKTP